MPSTGADMVEIDNAVDLSVAKARIGDQVVLVGNVHTVEELLQRDAGESRGRGATVHRPGGRGRRLLLGSGCIVPRHTPIANLQALVRVAHSQNYPVAA